ncbi:MAG TPA: hypothetical protein VG742_23140 [Dongiaceae bacterium]|nr:hypothetical protein [Dongiaceae bacterium]
MSPAASWDLAANTTLPPAPSDVRKVGGGFKWNARPTFQPVVAARDRSSATPEAAPPFDPPSFDPLADRLPPADARKNDANFDLTFSEPSYTDVTAEAQPLAAEAEPAEGSAREERGGPVNFPIGKSVKIKAQPLGGGLGGRVTFTFMLPTGD